jgi:hypothetical protein
MISGPFDRQSNGGTAAAAPAVPLTDVDRDITSIANYVTKMPGFNGVGPVVFGGGRTAFELRQQQESICIRWGEPKGADKLRRQR